MANEITLTTRLQLDNGNLKLDRNPGRRQYTQTTARQSSGVQTIGTGAHEALGVGADIGTAGYAFFQNLDATNFVQIGIDDGGTFEPFAKLTAGQIAIVPLNTKAVYAQADTAAVELEWIILEA